MIELQFFARYRDVLGSSGEQLMWTPELSTLEDLRQLLLARGEAWQVLAEPRLMCARNQELCTLDEPLADGDEIAFFPPVTGG
ncbi:MoaD/ThiS family protein [Halopseudomonas aestusnigri]|uniref:Molybdopterin synthase sulfur carrier subunit n=1 Tax=Halopseudomonas aestusnigri TaxID=857252 RepID=A0AAQ1G506_9GAMM|nr:MoaD/ThiS family protein [Halopseudomonas aestusnigri]OWL91225.1 molybdopterin synthase sulfur carrier subunit [Halopseudomonas aestusnigri]SEF63356.1 molybdopterin synthase sulfur carrier subunit [Halopseudomonas aestusnigri]